MLFVLILGYNPKGSLEAKTLTMHGIQFSPPSGCTTTPENLSFVDRLDTGGAEIPELGMTLGILRGQVEVPMWELVREKRSDVWRSRSSAASVFSFTSLAGIELGRIASPYS